MDARLPRPPPTGRTAWVREVWVEVNGPSKLYKSFYNFASEATDAFWSNLSHIFHFSREDVTLLKLSKLASGFCHPVLGACLIGHARMTWPGFSFFLLPQVQVSVFRWAAVNDFSLVRTGFLLMPLTQSFCHEAPAHLRWSCWKCITKDQKWVTRREDFLRKDRCVCVAFRLSIFHVVLVLIPEDY